MRTSYFALAALVMALPAAGQCETDKLPAPFPAPLSYFGSVLAIDGDTVVIGGQDSNQKRTAFVFERSSTGWSLEHELVGLQKGNYFITPVALRGNTLLLGQPNHSRVLVFERSGGGWNQTQVLAPSSPYDEGHFGSRLALDGDQLVVSAPTNSVSEYRAGTVFTYQRSGGVWNETGRLEASPPGYTGWFGNALDLESDLLVVGEPGFHTPFGDGNHVHVYRLQGGQWNLEQRLDEAPDLGFGYSVSVDQGRIAIGAYRDTTHGGPWRGSVRLFEKSGIWQEVLRLSTNLPDADDDFGATLELRGRWLAIGNFIPAGDQARQPVHLYELRATGWQLRTLLTPHGSEDGVWAPGFGNSLAIGGDTLWIGSPLDTPSADLKWSGAAYSYTFAPLAEAYCGPANLNSTGASAFLQWTGCGTVAQNDLVVSATSLPPHQIGLFLAADAANFVPFVGGSQGDLCVGGNVGRFLDQVGDSGASGEILLHVDLADLPTPSGSTSAQPGETWHFQCWFRDKNPGPTSNFTDAVRLGTL